MTTLYKLSLEVRAKIVLLSIVPRTVLIRSFSTTMTTFHLRRFSRKITTALHLLDYHRDYQHIAKGIASDFYPMDGWELIKQDFGRLANGGLNPVRSEGPYMILYNKYSGILRILAAFPGLGARQAINIRISFKKKDLSNANQNNLSVSALFNTYNRVAQSLDQPTVVNSVTTPAVFPGSDKRFFYADFQTSYDPCTCLFESALLVEFSTINQFTAQLSGRLVGVSESIATYSNNTYKLDKNQDYLTSIYKTDAATNNVESGMLMYKTVEKMVSDYKLKAITQKPDEPLLPTLLTAFAEFVSAGKLIGTVAGATGFPEALSAVGSLSSFLSTKLKAPAGSAQPALPSVIHGEMSMTGTITDQRLIGSSYFNFANPGSFKSNNKPEYNDGVNVSPPDVDYPIYNEVLRTFALLETPVLKGGSYLYTTMCYDDWGYDNGGSTSYVYQLASDLKYAFNPVANVNQTSSKVSAALVIDVESNTISNCDYTTEGINMKSVYRSDFSKPTKKETFISPFYELKYFKNLKAGIQKSENWNITHIYVRIQLEVVSANLDQRGQPNQAVNIITYEVPSKLNELSLSDK